MKNIIAIIAMATSMSAYAQTGVEKVRVEVTESISGEMTKTYVLDNTQNKKDFIAQHTEINLGNAHNVSGFTFSMSPTKEKNQYIVEVQDRSTAGFSSFQDDDCFISQKITLASSNSVQVIVSDKLKFNITKI